MLVTLFFFCYYIITPMNYNNKAFAKMSLEMSFFVPFLLSNVFTANGKHKKKKKRGRKKKLRASTKRIKLEGEEETTTKKKIKGNYFFFIEAFFFCFGLYVVVGTCCCCCVCVCCGLEGIMYGRTKEQLVEKLQV